MSRPAGNGLPLAVGREIDLTARRAFAGGRFTAQTGASWYFAGPFLEQSGRAATISWGYAQVTASF